MGGIDITYDVRTDARGRDPDTNSPTLRRYHQALWSKPLPNGVVFELTIPAGDPYLHHNSALGDFLLSSDSVLQSFTRWTSLQHLTSQFSEDENEEFRTLGYTIGGMLIFPANQVDRLPTINGARGMSRAIADRIDLTLEAIRRYYSGEGTSPLHATFDRYASFFGLFGDFRGYTEFFLLQDLVTSDFSAVRYLLPFDDFGQRATPSTIEEYRTYRENSLAFVVARNQRIHDAAQGIELAPPASKPAPARRVSRTEPRPEAPPQQQPKVAPTQPKPAAARTKPKGTSKPGKSWSAQETTLEQFRRLTAELAAPGAYAVLDLCASRAGQWVPLSEARALAGLEDTPGRMNSDLSKLTAAMKSVRGDDEGRWPFDSASAMLNEATGIREFHYRMPAEHAASWSELRRLTR